MAGGSIDVIYDSLVRKGNIKYAFQSLPGNSRAKTKVYGKSENKPNSVVAVVDIF